MTKTTCCQHAASGCNYPEGECLGLCAAPRWIPWAGGERPVDPDAWVTYTMRGGLTVASLTRAVDLRWSHLESAADIVAYRVLDKAVK